MTREEAIKELQSYADHSWGGLSEAFELAIAALREQDVTDTNVGNKWISVEERLPDHAGKFLVFETWAYGAWIDALRYTPNYSGMEEHLKGKAIWYKYDSEYGDYSVVGVTHWMPLPEPPEVSHG